MAPEGEDKMASGGEGAPPRPKGMRVCTWNANSLNERKRVEVIKVFKNRNVDVMGIQETHMRGCGVTECRRGSE